MRHRTNKISNPDRSVWKTKGPTPFLVLSELNFPFILNLNEKQKSHLRAHLILNSVKRSS